MRITMIAAMALIALTPVAAHAGTPLEQENAIWQAFKDKKVDAFKAMFAANYVGLYADGTYDLSKEVQSMKSTTLKSVSLSNFASRSLNSTDILTTYVATVKGMTGKEDISGRYNSASVWHRSGNKWLTVYHSEIKAK